MLLKFSLSLHKNAFESARVSPTSGRVRYCLVLLIYFAPHMQHTVYSPKNTKEQNNQLYLLILIGIYADECLYWAGGRFYRHENQ